MWFHCPALPLSVSHYPSSLVFSWTWRIIGGLYTFQVFSEGSLNFHSHLFLTRPAVSFLHFLSGNPAHPPRLGNSRAL
jgi:hypothetical protein